MSRSALIPPIVLVAAILLLDGCASMSSQALRWKAQLGEVPETQLTAQQLYDQVNVRQFFIPEGRYGRRYRRPMEPKYITIHSTQNYSGDANAHARAVANGKLRGGTVGYLYWHFTVQEDLAYQHLPLDEQGEHSDFDGPGNRKSIGIEMCEHRGNDIARTIDRTAQLTAVLMHTNNIPLSNVVPHYHWPREGYKPPNKNCPHFLLDKGKPGPTWRWFISRVKAHHDRIVKG